MRCTLQYIYMDEIYFLDVSLSGIIFLSFSEVYSPLAFLFFIKTKRIDLASCLERSTIVNYFFSILPIFVKHSSNFLKYVLLDYFLFLNTFLPHLVFCHTEHVNNSMSTFSQFEKLFSIALDANTKNNSLTLLTITGFFCKCIVAKKLG